MLPMLVEETDRLFATLDGEDKERQLVRAVTPLVYPFPHAGKLMALLFVPFAAWFVDQPLGVMQKLFWAPGCSASSAVRWRRFCPFLLDLQRLPSDMFQLFLVSGVYASRPWVTRSARSTSSLCLC